MIKIETVKCLDFEGRGIRGRKIVSVMALPKKSLPWAYLEGFPNCFFRDPVIQVRESYDVSFFIAIDQWKEEEYFDDCLKLIYACGDRLKAVNSDLKKKKDDWHGSETFII